MKRAEPRAVAMGLEPSHGERGRPSGETPKHVHRPLSGNPAHPSRHGRHGRHEGPDKGRHGHGRASPGLGRAAIAVAGRLASPWRGEVAGPVARLAVAAAGSTGAGLRNNGARG